MNQRTVLQIPMSTELRELATEAALLEGFSSLQEAVRVVLKKLAKREMRIAITESVELSERAQKRYAKMDRDFETGKNVYTYNGVEEMLESLGYVKDRVTQTVRKTPKTTSKARK